MNYYFIQIAQRLDEDFCFLQEKPPKDIHLLSSFIASGEEASDDYPEGVKAKMSDKRGGLLLSDFLANRNFLLVVSRRVKDVIESINTGKTEFLPVTIVNHKGRDASSEYYYVNPIGTYECLDYEKSSITYFEGTKNVIDVDKYVLSAKKVERLPDLFRPIEDEVQYIFSQKLVDALSCLEPKVTNFALEEVEVFNNNE